MNDHRLMSIEPEGMADAMDLALRLSESGLIPKAMQGSPANVLLTLLTGRALGIPAVLALSRIHVIEGVPRLAADAMLGVAMAHPLCVYIALIESTDQVATYEANRKGWPQPLRLSFTIDDARKAGLAGRGNWAKYPAAMLRARAGSAIARAVFPDVLSGVYDPDEMHDVDAERAAAQRGQHQHRELPAQYIPQPMPVLDVEPEPEPEPEAPFGIDDLGVVVASLDWTGAPQWARPPDRTALGQWLDADISEMGPSDLVAAAATVTRDHAAFVEWLSQSDTDSGNAFADAVAEAGLEFDAVFRWAKGVQAGGASALACLTPARRRNLAATLVDPAHPTRKVFDSWLAVMARAAS